MWIIPHWSHYFKFQLNLIYPLFIIIPTYNRANLIGRAIDSIIKQTYTNWEIIVIDDGSTDTTKVIMDEYLKDSRIKFISYPENKGVNHARNVGIERATGDVIALLDSDDLLLENALKMAKDFIETYLDYDIFFFGTMDEKTWKRMFKIPYDGFSPSYKETMSSKKIRGEFWGVFKSYVFKKYKYFDGLNGFEGVVYLQMFRMYKLVCSKQVLRIYGNVEQSLTRPIPTKTDKKRWDNIKQGNKIKLSILGDDLKNII
ncbi:MAG: glycosyltransferase family 2 protein [bacterium]